MKTSIYCQAFYNWREQFGLISGTEMHDSFREIVKEPVEHLGAPSGRTFIYLHDAVDELWRYPKVRQEFTKNEIRNQLLNLHKAIKYRPLKYNEFINSLYYRETSNK